MIHSGPDERTMTSGTTGNGRRGREGGEAAEALRESRASVAGEKTACRDGTFFTLYSVN